MRLQFRFEEHLHLGAHARFVGEFALEDVVDAEHQVEPADGVFAELALGIVDVFDEFLEGVFAAGGGGVGGGGGADELYDVHVVEEDGGVACRIIVEGSCHEIG